MKKLTPLVIFSITGLCMAALPAVANTGTATVRVAVTGAKSDDGEIGCALMSDKKRFPKKAKPEEQIWVTPSKGAAICLFKNVAPGSYAVSVSHDLNGNRKTDTNFLGIPKEAWGVSQNVRPGMRAPKFREAEFLVSDSETVELDVRIKK